MGPRLDIRQPLGAVLRDQGVDDPLELARHRPLEVKRIAQAVVDGVSIRSGRVLLYRRMARLLPLYLAVVLLVWSLTNPTAPGHWVDLLTHLTFTHVYSDTYIFWTNGPAWTLAIEFHFYVLVALSVPVLNRVAARATTRGRRLAVASALPVALVVVGAAYLVWATLLSGAAADNWSVWFSPLAKAADFGVGMLLAVVAAAGVDGGRASMALSSRSPCGPRSKAVCASARRAACGHSAGSLLRMACSQPSSPASACALR